MKKKVARVLFAFVLILAMIPLTASAESSADTEDNEVTEQFDLATGETYYFDLTCLGNATGTVNDSLPDKTLHYVPVTYVGTVDAYRLPEYTWPMTAITENPISMNTVCLLQTITSNTE